MTQRLAPFFVLLLASSCIAEEAPPPETGRRAQSLGTLEQVTDFGSNPGQLTMHVYVPADMPPEPRPLVVAMHGCSMTASAYTAAGWHSMADLWKLYVVYPEQNKNVNNSLGCFNWGGVWPSAPNAFAFNEPLDTGTILRGQSENLSIKQMVDYMKDRYEVDDNRVYATGVSAGGGMTAVMLATYPDVFAGGAIVAGIPYGCTIVPGATTQEGTDCTKAHPESHQLNRTASEWGDLVRAANPGYSGPYPVVSIWQGGADYMVAPDLRHELVEQWTDVHGIGAAPSESDEVLGAQRDRFRDGSGRVVVESYFLPGAQHTQPIDPAANCGEPGAFITDEGICVASIAGEFFELEGDGGGQPTNPDAGPGGGGADGGGGGCGGCDAGGGGGSFDGDPPPGFQCRCAGGSSDPASLILIAGACALAIRRRCWSGPTA